jgi:hypothetical protein
MMSANRVVASGWMEGTVVVSLCTETTSNRRNSNMCVSETQNTHMSEVGGRKESIQLINDNLKQNNRRGGIVGLRCSMVKIPHAKPGYIGLNSAVKGRDK